MRMFDMSNDSRLLKSRMELESEGYYLEGNIFRRNERKPSQVLMPHLAYL